MKYILLAVLLGLCSCGPVVRNQTNVRLLSADFSSFYRTGSRLLILPMAVKEETAWPKYFNTELFEERIGTLYPDVKVVPFRTVAHTLAKQQKQETMLGLLNTYFTGNQVDVARLAELRSLADCDYCLFSRLRKFETIVGFDRHKKKKLYIEGVLVDWRSGTPIWEFVSFSVTGGRSAADLAGQDQLLRDIWTHIAERLPQKPEGTQDPEQKENW
jgi:hypothetical protein